MAFLAACNDQRRIITVEAQGKILNTWTFVFFLKLANVEIKVQQIIDQYVGCVDFGSPRVLLDVCVGSWDDMWVVFIWITVRVVRRPCW